MIYDLKKHELMHAASMAMEDFDNHCLSRTKTEDGGDIALSPNGKEAAQKAFNALFRFYQIMGEECMPLPTSPK